ncbi:MAG: DUF11 domain-containing protein, partial [Anaerolineae bacterium]
VPCLALNKQANPNPVSAGEQLTYTIHVTNTGNVTLTATITDDLPEHVTHVTGDDTLTWTPDIVPDDVWTTEFIVTVESGYAGTLVNVVWVTTDEGATGTYTHTAHVVPRVGFHNVTYDVDEGSSPATISITLNATPCLTATVDYATSDGTATASEDYTETTGTLTFTPGTTARTFTISITNDTVPECNETVLLTLSNPINAMLGTSSATLTIIDDAHCIYLPVVLKNGPDE